MVLIDTKHLMHYSKDLTVILAEDDPVLLEELGDLLESLFKNVVRAGDGMQAWEHYAREGCDLLITDIEMPRMDGVELCRNVRERSPEQIILVVSAYDEPQYLIPLINLNIDGFLSKPILHEPFIQTLYKHAKDIAEHKALNTYREKLEEDTHTLSLRISELERELSGQPVKKAAYHSIIEIVDALEADKDKITQDWVTHREVVATLRTHNIAAEFFRKFFGLKVLEYLIGVVRMQNQPGNCPVIIAMLDFFKHKRLPLSDIFTVCVNFKNTMTAYVFSRYGYDEALFDELSVIMDKNFAGVIRQYIKIHLLDKTAMPVREETADVVPATPQDAAPSCALNLHTPKPLDAENYLEYILEHDAQELKELESDIDDLAIAIAFRRLDPVECTRSIGEKLSKYGSVLISYPVFSQLGGYIGRLGSHFLASVDAVREDPERLNRVALLIESFVNDLVVWRTEVFENCAPDPDFLNHSFSSNVDTIINFMKDEPVADDDDGLEFF